MNIEYKGFTIFPANRDGTGVRYHIGNYVIGSERGFNPDGYATENAAKGAITKYISKQDYQNALDNEVFPPEARAAINDEGSKVPAANVETDITTVGTIKVKLAASDAKDYSSARAAWDAGTPYSNALLAYYGISRQINSDRRSRNKREGGYAGKFHGSAGHKRAGKNRLYTLKENARYNKSLDQGE